MVYVVGTAVASDGKDTVVSAETFLDAFTAFSAWQKLQHTDGLKVAAPVPRDSPFSYGNPAATAQYATYGSVIYFLIPSELIEEKQS